MRSALLMAAYRGILRPGLFRAYGGDPEKIHEAMIALLARLGGTPLAGLARILIARPRRGVRIAGIDFPGPVGVAAGLDKDGLAAPIWAALGFGFAELGTVTAQAQPGNPKPRVFRLPQSRALINRMGFNNAGAAALAERLAGWGVRRGERTLGLPLGVSIGKTKLVELDQAVDDYRASLIAVHRVADYLAVNVSSPNTPGLRTLQSPEAISDLVSALVTEAKRLDAVPLPIFVKLAPDLTDQALDSILAAVCEAGAAGLIATNTTLTRAGLRGADRALADQAGGLSGAPLTVRARRMVARVARSGLPVIASGGIMSLADAQAMVDLGAAAVQLYSGFIYSGPGLVGAINTGLEGLGESK